MRAYPKAMSDNKRRAAHSSDRPVSSGSSRVKPVTRRVSSNRGAGMGNPRVNNPRVRAVGQFGSPAGNTYDAHNAGAYGKGAGMADGKSASAYAADAYGVVRGKSGKKRMSRAKKVILGIVIAIVLVIAGVGVAAALYINSIASNMAFDDQEAFDSLKEVLAPVEEEDGASYALILGSDAREGDTASRSDVIMLARLDPADGIAELISIPRDTMVTIEGHGTNKINAAYAYGGASGAVECISEFAGVPISHYVEVHFSELEEAVDALGGITVYIPEDIKAGNGGMSFSKGEQVINGEQALAFARERYNVSGGDFGRAQAQRMILTAIVEKVVGSPVTEIPGIVSELSSCVSTDYALTDLVDLALTYKDAGLTMYTAACPSYTHNVNGVSYVATMFDEWREMMQRVDASLDPEGDDPIPDEQANDPDLGAATNSPAPRDYESLAANALSTDDVADVE